MRPRFFFLGALLLLLVLGGFLVLGVLQSTRLTREVLEEEARSLLSIVALAQENSIFGEASFEEGAIDRLVGIVRYLESTGREQATLERVRVAFTLDAIVILDARRRSVLVRCGTGVTIPDQIYDQAERLWVDYHDDQAGQVLRFAYRAGERLYYIEGNSEAIREFNRNYGISKILSEVSSNPVFRYLVLQDPKGILYATPNVSTIGRIDDDPELQRVMSSGEEVSRITAFDGEGVLEVVQPFVVDNRTLGIFRIGVSLRNYERHLDSARLVFVLIFLLLFAAGSMLLHFFLKYQRSSDLGEFFSRTLGSLEEGVLMVGRNGLVTGTNEVFMRLAGCPGRSIVRDPYHKLFPDDPFGVMAVMRTGTRIEQEGPFRGLQLQIASYPVFDTRNRITGVIMILRDVTRIRRFEREQRETERLAFLGNLVANFAHEIRNPLNGLGIAAQRLVREHPGDDPSYQQLTTTLLREIDVLNRTLNDFLALVRPQVREPMVFDLGSAVEEALAVAAETARGRQVELTHQVQAGLAVRAVRDDVKRAVLNLLLNAIEAVQLEGAAGRIVRLGLHRQGERVEISVSDTGPGIDPAVRERIFEPYYTTKQGGTGLGLYICRRIVEENCGTITVESGQECGTVFRVSFPVTGGQA